MEKKQNKISKSQKAVSIKINCLGVLNLKLNQIIINSDKLY